jgi:hypothetical protein
MIFSRAWAAGIGFDRAAMPDLIEWGAWTRTHTKHRNRTNHPTYRRLSACLG